MNKIAKNYLKSFLKDLLISILMVLYLVFMFLLVNIVSNTSIQYYEQYSKILKNSNNWDADFNDMFVNWNFTYIGDKTKDPNANLDDYKTFDFINNLKDKNGQKYLVSNNWYKILYLQTTKSKTFFFPTEGYVNIKNDARDNHNRLSLFNDSLSQDIKQFTLFQDQKSSNWKNVNLIFHNDKNKKYTLGNIFNPNADWQRIDYCLNDAIINELDGTKNKKNILRYNQTLLLENNYSSSGKTRNKNLDNPIGSSLTAKPISELLSITFDDNNKRNGMSQVFLQTKNSRMPKNNSEILVNQQLAKDKGWKIGDKINLFGSNKIQISDKQKLTNKFYTIVGYGLSLSDSTPHNLNNNSNSFSNINYTYGSIYTTYSEFLNIKKQIYNGLSRSGNNENNNNEYSWYIDSNKGETNKPAYNFSFILGTALLAKPGIYNKIFNEVIQNKYINLNEVNGFSLQWINSYIYKEIINNKTKMIINFSILLFVSLFSFIFLNLIIKRDINNSERQLGIFKAMGYKTKELAWIYAYKTLMTFFIASIFGYIFSIPLQIYSTSFIFKQPLALTINSFNYTWWFLVILFIFVPLLFATISFFINLRYIKKSPIHLIYNNNTAKNIWLLKIFKKIFVKTGSTTKLKLSFSVQTFYKWLIILIIFVFANVSLMLSNSAIDSIGNLVENNSLGNIYNKDVNTVVSEEQPHPNHILNNNGKLQTIYDINDSPGKDQFNPIAPNEKIIKKSVNYWNKILNPLNIEMIMKTKINDYPYINIYDLKNLLNSKIQNRILSNVGIDNDNIKLTLLYLYYNSLYNNKNYNNSTIICLNRNVMDFNSNYSFLINSIFSPIFSKEYNKPFINIYGIDDSSKNNEDNYNNYKKFFESNGINENDFDKILNYDNNDKEIPVIISEKVAKIFNWKIGQIITSKPNSSLDTYELSPFKNVMTANKTILNINLKIVGINNNIYSANMTTSYKNLAKFYKDKENNVYVDNSGNVKSYSLDNRINSLDNYYPNEYDLNDVADNYTSFISELNKHPNDLEKIPKNPSINIKYFPIIINNSILSTDETVYKVLNNNSFVYYYNNFTSNIVYTKQTKESINNIYGVVKKVQLVTTVLTYILVTILILLSLALIIDENKRIIMLLKIIGYQNKKINWVTTGNIIFIVLFSLIFGSIVSFLILKFIENFIWIKFHFLVSLPLSLVAVFEITLLTTIVSGIIWKVCMNLINKKKTEELSRYD